MGAGREGTGRRAFSKALRRGIEQRPVLPEWSYGSKGQQAGHKGPGELLSDLDFLPTALGHHGRVGRRAGSTVLEETSDGCLFKSRGTSKAGYPDPLHPPGQSLPTAKARVRDSSLPLWPLGLQSRSTESEGALRKEKVLWFQTSVPRKEAACQSVSGH